MVRKIAAQILAERTRGDGQLSNALCSASPRLEFMIQRDIKRHLRRRQCANSADRAEPTLKRTFSPAQSPVVLDARWTLSGPAQSVFFSPSGTPALRSPST